MTKVTLKDGTQLDSIAVHSDRKFIDNTSREILTFLFPSTYDIYQLKNLFTEENTSTITLGEYKTDENQNVIEEPFDWKNYITFLSAGSGVIADVIIGSTDMSECTWIKMMQPTPEELRIKELEAQLAALNK